MRVEHPPPFGARWRARWIWASAPAITTESATRPVLADPRDTVVLLRRAVDVTEVPERAPARIWADGRYRLTVNGVELARGPVRSDPRRARYDLVDLAPELRVGANVIAITARHFGRATSWWTPVPPTYSLGAGAIVFEALVGDEWVVSDRHWTASPGDAWTPVPVPGDVAALPLEWFDARRHPHGWDRPGGPGSDWRPAREITPVHTGFLGDPHPPSEPFGLLLPPVRSAPPGGEVHPAIRTAVVVTDGAEDVDDPVAQVLADEAAASAAPPDAVLRGAEASNDRRNVAAVAFDLGHVAAGTVRLEVDGAPAGAMIDLAVAEHLDADGHLATLGQHAGLRYVCAGEPEERFESFDVVGGRHLHASVRLPSAGAPLPEIRVLVAERLRPRPDGAMFACSDPVLQRIWEVGARTVDLCALDAYVDCPTREQRAWTGDSVVHQRVDLVTNPDWSMARWHPQLAAAPRPDGMLPMAPASDFAADDRTFIPDWSLHWIRSVWNLYRYTGDRELVGELLPVAERVLRWFEPYLGADDLLHDVTGWALLDWSSVYSRDCSSVLNALWARSLEDVAEMADWLGNGAAAAWTRGRRDAVSAAFEVFWDDARGVYVDHTVEGQRQLPAAQHGGAAALAAGLVPPERVELLISRLLDRNRLVRHSWVMDDVVVGGSNSGFIHLVTGYPPPVWDAVDEMVECQPFFRYVLHEGLARVGRADLIADLCRDWTVFLDAGHESWPECWLGGTTCHGWSSTPTADLVTMVLGITPAEPGYAAVRIEPALGGLEWARATVPTPHGFLTVEARADGTLLVESPVPVVERSPS